MTEFGDFLWFMGGTTDPFVHLVNGFGTTDVQGGAGYYEYWTQCGVKATRCFNAVVSRTNVSPEAPENRPFCPVCFPERK